MSYRNEQTAHLPALTDAELREVEHALADRLTYLTDHADVSEWARGRAAVVGSVLTAVREARMRLNELRPPS